MFYLQILINGILLGALYGVMAIGLSLVWGVMNFINLAHGILIVVGAYVTFWLYEFWGIDPFITLIPSMACGFVFCFFLQKYLINLVVRGVVFMTMILTWGINIFLINMGILAFTVDYRLVSTSYRSAGIEVASLTIPYIRLAILGVALALTLALYLFMSKTKTGNAIKAVGLDKDAARLMGINVAKIYSITLGIGGALAAASGTLTSTIFSFSPIFGEAVGLKCFVIVCLGGLGNMGGAIAGGLVLGLAEVFGSVFIGESYKNALAFGILVLILILRPEGIMGKKFFAEVKN